jgi:hypothetical protein
MVLLGTFLNGAIKIEENDGHIYPKRIERNRKNSGKIYIKRLKSNTLPL